MDDGVPLRFVAIVAAGVGFVVFKEVSVPEPYIGAVGGASTAIFATMWLEAREKLHGQRRRNDQEAMNDG